MHKIEIILEQKEEEEEEEIRFAPCIVNPRVKVLSLFPSFNYSSSIYNNAIL